ncbi:hypothetical protein Q3O98_18065 [Ralstonia pseudosolanacearum]|uniref:hypothetical protein n=1 Tax=Ralstonia pseudosolanacearum TaxID=1310165 RepID=UPI0026753C89|nr:hypothetical protein [Ralstonia pseudosolanacearum]MDO3622990.1 hypothetical protein [Ralstonia pseudosolanacearum]
MKPEHCPQCNALTPTAGTVIRSDGKREALYRCTAHRCATLFSHALPLSQQGADGVQTYRDRRVPSEKRILTDC